MAKKKNEEEDPNKQINDPSAQENLESGDPQITDPAVSGDPAVEPTIDPQVQVDDRVSRAELDRALQDNTYLKNQLSTIREKPQEGSLSGYSKKELYQLKQQHPQHQAVINEELDQRNNKEIASITDKKVQAKLNEIAVYGLHGDFQDTKSNLHRQYQSYLSSSPYLRDHADGVLFAAKSAMLDMGIVDANKSKAQGSANPI